MKQTPLYEKHKALGAKIIDFGGWAMPVQYSGILDEHKTVRSSAGIFDVSHMGEVMFRGPRAAEAVQKLVSNDVGKLAVGHAMYTVACRPNGGIVDDLIVYHSKPDVYLIVVNASNIDKDVAWFRENTGQSCELNDLSDELCLLAVQGPKAVEIVQSLSKSPIAAMKSFDVGEAEVAGRKVHVARTGYTGEDGVEIFVENKDAPGLWDLFVEKGVKPIGLGARDTLRLEARLCLYGNDIDEEHTPLEAGLGWVVKGKGFIGEEALARQKAEGVKRKLVGFVMKDKATARHGYPIVDPQGVVTSGSIGPTVGANIGMGWVPAEKSEPGTRIVIDVRGKQAAAEIVKGPFYKRK